MTVLVAIAALVYTNENNLAQRQEDRTQRLLVEQGQITDRFSKAVDQLGEQGAEKIDVRIGAIFSLQRIMRDSPSRQDQPAVTELLAAFVRTHSLRRSESAIPADIQLALKVIATRDPRHDDAGYTVDLSDADLNGANLPGAHLDDSMLRGTHLAKSQAYDARLRNAYLGRADLTDADFSGAVLTNAEFAGTRLRGTDLSNADLTGAVLECVDLSGADLERANMTNVRSGWFNPPPLGPMNINLPHGSQFLADCPVPGPPVTFKGANLRNANLTGADLGQSDLSGAILRCAKLEGADLASVKGLTGNQLAYSTVDANTELPAGVSPPGPVSKVNDLQCI